MDFDFSPDQRQLQDEVGRMLRTVSTSAEVRRSLEGIAPYSAATWRQLIDMGAAPAAIPEAFGGAGLGYLELCLVAEEAGRHLAATPLLSTIYLATEALLLGGSPEQRQTWLPKIARGDLIATALLNEPSHRLVKEAPLHFANGRLDGTVLAVPDGGAAGLAILRAGEELVLADLTAPGVSKSDLASLDPTKPLAALHFENAPAERLGGTIPTETPARRVLDGAAVLVAFEQVGGASAALEAARTYSLERRAFGRQIGGFQALKHKMANIYTANELAKVHAYFGAWALSSNAPELGRAAAAARVAATAAYDLAAKESLHIHGGIGFTWDMDCHLHLRRSRYLGQIIGSEHVWRMRLAEALIEEAA
jgi:acyl-CoA dehydrogenase